MYRTITLRLNHRYEEDKEKLLKTMEAFAHAYNMSAEYGFEKKENNKIGNSMAMYHKIRNAIPGLPSSMVQSACFMATEALKMTKFKTLPKKSPISCIRYTWRGACCLSRKRICDYPGFEFSCSYDIQYSKAFQQISRLENSMFVPQVRKKFKEIPSFGGSGKSGTSRDR